MTKKSRKIQVIEQFKPFQQFLVIYQSRNYRDVNQRPSPRKICLIVGFSLALLGTSICCITDAWFCVDQHLDLNVIAQPLSVLVGIIQIHFVFVSIISRTRRIGALVNSLQEIVEDRMFHTQKTVEIGFRKK